MEDWDGLWRIPYETQEACQRALELVSHEGLERKGFRRGVSDNAYVVILTNIPRRKALVNPGRDGGVLLNR